MSEINVSVPRRIDRSQAKVSKVHNFQGLCLVHVANMKLAEFHMYDYCEPQTTWPPCLVVSVLDYETRDKGRFPAGNLFISIFFFSSFLAF